jgi:secreted PhoX family phosphatase
VTNFQRPEDGAWDPNNPNDFYFVTTSSFGPIPDENKSGETRLWRLRFADPADPSQGGTLKLLVSGPVGTADSPSSTGSQSAASPGPQMLDNITVNDRGQVIMLEDVGNQAYRGGVWIYDISRGSLAEIAIADPDVFTPGEPGFVTKDEEASGIIPAPFLGADAYLVDEQVHKKVAPSPDPDGLVEGGQFMKLHIPPGRKF